MADFTSINENVNQKVPDAFDSKAEPLSREDLPLTPDEQVKADAERIAALEAAAAVQQQKGNNRLVMTDEGERSLDDILKESKAYRLQQEAASITAEQKLEARLQQLSQTRWKPNGEVGWAPDQVSTTPLYGTMSAVADKFGLLSNNWTTTQKAKAVTTTQAMLDSYNLEEYFGRKSDSIKSSELIRENPLLYKLLKEKAIKLNKF